MNSDFKELLQAFVAEGVKYLIVGGYAVVHHARPRFTKDLDLWIEPNKDNAQRVLKALRDFGIPLIGVEPDDFAQPGLQYVIGRPPVQFDFLTSLPGLEFSGAWERKSTGKIGALEIHFLGIEDLRTAKKIAARPQDLIDLEELGEDRV
jgi:hypothetical protein